MTTHSSDFYQRLGVKPIINAASWITVHGGSIMPSPVVQAMEEASRWFVDMHELNRKAGDVIARMTGAEAGLVTAGSAAGMVLEAAACIAGNDPAKSVAVAGHIRHEERDRHPPRSQGQLRPQLQNGGRDSGRNRQYRNNPRMGTGGRYKRKYRCRRLCIRTETWRRPLAVQG